MPQSMDTEGQCDVALAEHHRTPWVPVVYDGPVCTLCPCAEKSTAISCAGESGADEQKCATCPMRLRDAKKLGKLHHHPGHGDPGRQCNRCYQKALKGHPSKRPSTATPAAASTAKRPRRTHSDPGEPVNLTRKRTRAHPPTVTPAAKKPRLHTPAVDPTLLLDQAHAARLTLIAAEAIGAQPAKRSTKRIAAHRIASWRLVVCD